MGVEITNLDNAGMFTIGAVGDWVQPPTVLSAGVDFGVYGGNGVLVLSPLFLPAGRGIDRLALELTAAGSAGSVVRLVAYNYNPNTGRPGTLLVDGGTIDGTSATSQSVSFTAVYPTTSVILVGAVSQGSAGTQPDSISSASHGFTGGPTLIGNFHYGAWYVSGITGAAPASVTIEGSYGTSPRVQARLA
jgi:hypothetical protein